MKRTLNLVVATLVVTLSQTSFAKSATSKELARQAQASDLGCDSKAAGSFNRQPKSDTQVMISQLANGQGSAVAKRKKAQNTPVIQ